MGQTESPSDKKLPAGADPPTSPKRSASWWLALIVFILIPIRYGHWWMTAIALAVCALLGWFLFAPE